MMQRSLGSTEAKSATTTQVAIGWALSRRAEIVPVIGSRRRKQLTEALGALDLELTVEDLVTIQRAIPADVDIILGRGIDLDLDIMQSKLAKLVRSQRVAQVSDHEFPDLLEKEFGIHLSEVEVQRDVQAPPSLFDFDNRPIGRLPTLSLSLSA